jgi:bifunctional DNA-binding transcriptional regulator/antitoxin component of YhaV-PrlF toxin-antitoxin module
MYQFTWLVYRGIVGEQSFSFVLPKKYAVDLGIGKGDFVKVHQDEGRIIIEKVWENKIGN